MGNAAAGGGVRSDRIVQAEQMSEAEMGTDKVYRNLMIVTAAVAVVLAVLYGLATGMIYLVLGIDAAGIGATTDFVARRAAVLFFGFAVVLWSLRDLPPSWLRRGICQTAWLTLAAMAVLGAAEALRGFASPMIWSVVVFELVLAGGYFALWRHERNA